MLERCRRGDLGAWDRLLEDHYDEVIQFLFQLDPGLTRDAASELAGQVFDRAVSSIDTAVEDHATPRVWLMRVAADCVRGRTEAQSNSSARSCNEAILLRRLLDRVGGPCRDILELAFFGGLETKELAAALEIEPATVGPRIHMCLNRLEVFLQQDASGEFRTLQEA